MVVSLAHSPRPRTIQGPGAGIHVEDNDTFLASHGKGHSVRGERHPVHRADFPIEVRPGRLVVDEADSDIPVRGDTLARSQGPIKSNNPFDQAGRYLAKLEPAAFLAWLPRLTLEQFRFRRWLNVRR
jgi:hypothetical protein